MESLGRIEVVGAQGKSEVLLGQVCGRRLKRNGMQPSLTLSFLWGMEEGYIFWKDVWCGDEALFFPLSIFYGNQ